MTMFTKMLLLVSVCIGFSFSQSKGRYQLIDIKKSLSKDIVYQNILKYDSLFKEEIKKTNGNPNKYFKLKNNEIIKWYILEKKMKNEELSSDDLIYHEAKITINSTDFTAQIPGHLFLNSAPFNLIDFGIGLQAVSIGMNKDRKFGFLESLAPLQITFNLFQRSLFRKNEERYFAFWCPSLGLIFSKPVDNEISFGAALIPYSIRINDFSFGFGVKYQDSESFKPSDVNRWSVIIPISYQLWNKKDAL